MALNTLLMLVKYLKSIEGLVTFIIQNDIYLNFNLSSLESSET